MLVVCTREGIYRGCSVHAICRFEEGDLQISVFLQTLFLLVREDSSIRDFLAQVFKEKYRQEPHYFLNRWGRSTVGEFPSFLILGFVPILPQLFLSPETRHPANQAFSTPPSIFPVSSLESILFPLIITFLAGSFLSSPVHYWTAVNSHPHI